MRSAEPERHEVLADPLRKRVAAHDPRSAVEDDTLRVVNARVKLVPVEHQEDIERRVADALVAIDKGMVPDE